MEEGSREGFERETGRAAEMERAGEGGRQADERFIKRKEKMM